MNEPTLVERLLKIDPLRPLSDVADLKNRLVAVGLLDGQKELIFDLHLAHGELTPEELGKLPGVEESSLTSLVDEMLKQGSLLLKKAQTKRGARVTEACREIPSRLRKLAAGAIASDRLKQHKTKTGNGQILAALSKASLVHNSDLWKAKCIIEVGTDLPALVQSVINNTTTFSKAAKLIQKQNIESCHAAFATAVSSQAVTTKRKCRPRFISIKHARLDEVLKRARSVDRLARRPQIRFKYETLKVESAMLLDLLLSIIEEES